MTRWVDLKTLAAETGLEQRTLQYIRQREPGVLVTRGKAAGTGFEYGQPDCSVALRKREKAKAQKSTERRGTSFTDARARKMDADARLAEMKAATEEGLLIPLEMYEKELDTVFSRIKSVIDTLPFKRIGQIQVVRTDVEAVAVGELIRDDLLKALQGLADDGDDSDGPEAAA
jgi:phage terminase Nu1 subunit (DNA packaging protein)